jgi:hypothetical protein
MIARMEEAARRDAILRTLPWFVVPAAGAMWAARALRHTYYFYDEWSMIDRVVHLPAGSGTFASFNGHLWMFQYWLYRVQVSAFGLDDHRFVAVVFVVSLVLLQLAVAAVVHAAGVSSVISLLLGGLVTYLGVASQNFIFAIQTSTTLSSAACLAAGAVVLRRRPSVGSAAAAAALMLAAVGFDSATALSGIAFVTVVMTLMWRTPWAVASAPAILALAAWYLFGGHLGPEFQSSAGEQASFARRLVLTATGGLVGRAEVAGAVLSIVAAVVLVLGFRRGWIEGSARAVLAAGLLATVVVTVGLARSRAGVVGSDFVNFNRYLQNVALPLTIATAPALAAVGRRAANQSWSAGRSRTAALIAAAGIAVAFAMGIGPMRSYSSSFRAWNQTVLEQIRAASTVVRDRCPGGGPPDPAGQPLGDLSPQVTTGLLQELVARGALTAYTAPSEGLVSRMCSSSAAPG